LQVFQVALDGPVDVGAHDGHQAAFVLADLGPQRGRRDDLDEAAVGGDGAGEPVGDLLFVGGVGVAVDQAQHDGLGGQDGDPGCGGGDLVVLGRVDDGALGAESGTQLQHVVATHQGLLADRVQ